MKKKMFAENLRLHAEKTNSGFLLGWAALSVLLIFGDLIGIREHGLFTLWGALYVGTGIGLYLLGAWFADTILARKNDAAFAKGYNVGYGVGMAAVFKSIDKWGRL